MSAQKFKKRFGFARTNTDDRLPTSSGNNDSIEMDAPSTPIPAEELGLDEKDPAYAEVRDISETEANRKLSIFHANHRWDPNMSNDAFEVIDEVTNTRDVKAEAQLVGDMIENSPYPEVRLSHKHCHIPRHESFTNIIRFELLSVIMMKTYLSTPSALGSSVWYLPRSAPD